MIPYYPIASSAGQHEYSNTTWWRRLVSDYTGLSFPEVGELNYRDYLILRRDAFLFMLEGTQAGQKYLDNAWRMEQTEPDRPALRKKFGKEGKNSG